MTQNIPDRREERNIELEEQRTDFPIVMNERYISLESIIVVSSK